ncbi:GvpL/GvpF family gas vesicle protein [Falsiroseomonas selenitidurans]|uniref:GvpL/GvpF family gas vesicle protein n=1 Tax=Falsiroseomonas selenitidurans TaxID=2716335 RepID=A0ABX1EBF1_9PROT|nr:GvpL/GvpF family gas vesicle protein [Falsiroseomonas selenitidurans]NKC34547.1 GvpL/GvpF family gas vesicle protein [Falsiroseomonas selenitidurans]
MSGGLWLYGIGLAAPGGAPLGDGVAGAAVQPMEAAGFVALVSDAPAERPAPTRRHMLTHTAVLERATAAADVLPVRFGTVAPDATTLARCLAANAMKLRDAMAAISDCVELGLRVSWREGVIFEEILAAEPALRALRDRLATRPMQETYQDRIALGRRVEAALAARRTAEAASLDAKLAPLAVQMAVLREVDEAMLLNRAFLVKRSEETRFDAAVAALEAAQAGRLLLRYVGPVPPFNFVSLRAEWFGAPAQAA